MFSARRAQHAHDQEACQAQGYQQIGPLQVEWDWLKKKLDVPRDARRELLEPTPPPMSLARPCALVGLPRSTSSSQGQGESAEHRTWMR